MANISFTKELHALATFALHLTPDQEAWIIAVKSLTTTEPGLEQACKLLFANAAKLRIEKRFAHAIVISHIRHNKVIISDTRLTSIRNKAYADFWWE